MKDIIVVAGATGNLGRRICRELIKNEVTVRAIVRSGSAHSKVDALRAMGVEVHEVAEFSAAALKASCLNASCVVSALAGLQDVILDAQLELLNAAMAAGVPRFIPSDFSSDYTLMPEGENRNFDLRKSFQKHIDQTAIQATSIFNGCFADALRYNTPLFNVKEQTIAYYDHKQDWKVDFTTMDDTAAYTAAAAVDASTPKVLRIASFSVSPNELVNLSEQYKGNRFKLVDMGSMEGFSAYNKIQRANDPEGEKELYPRWQQAQYLYSMLLVQHPHLDNDRYPNLEWSKVEENI